MSMSSAVAINIVLDIGIVVAILSVLGWGMRAQVRDMKAPFVVERRRRRERRAAERVGSGHPERRRGERRGSGPVTA
jgi:hypothetical protein